ncbi:MAG: undecaprenyl-diphosphate phosphatase [Actinomycetota bacterium]
MPLLHALLLGFVQGLTELLPISSSGHAVLVPFILGWREPTPAVLFAMYAGTLIALLYVFGSQLRSLVAPDNERGRYLASLVVVGALPATIVGLAFTTVLQRTFGRPVATAAMLGLTGYLLLGGERWAADREEELREQQLVAVHVAKAESHSTVPHLRGEDQLDARDAMIAGAAQSTGFVPGMSRIGTTVAAGMRVGLDRPTALRYAFLLTVPSVVIAMVAQASRVFAHGAHIQPLPMIVAVIGSAGGGVLGVRWFISIFAKSGLRLFGVYCFAMMTLGLLSALARG